MTSFAHRGVVEGFYGPSYDATDRRWLVESMGRWGMNRYLYAPKDDPLQRERWREPYPPERLEDFRSLVEHGAAHAVDVGFAISPGLSIRYSNAGDLAQLVSKLRAFQDLGVRFFGLALDDVPSRLQHAEDHAAFGSLGEAHARLANALLEELASDTLLWLIPTDYTGLGGSDYLGELGARLEASVEIGWTGRTVLSPSITRAEAQARADAVGRPLLLWDNTPVADGPMRPMLHLGPYVGRSPDLAGPVSGILLNPMEIARASAPTLASAARYLNDPEGYEPESAWRSAIEELAGEAAEPFECFARAHRFSALLPEDRDEELEDACEALKRAVVDGGESATARARFRTLLEPRRAAAGRLREELGDGRLLGELGPWLDAHHHECERMNAAIDLLDALEAEHTGMERALAFFSFEGRLTRIPIPAKASFGPRRVIYPQLVSMDDEGASFGGDEVLFRDQCLADRVVGLAEEHAVRALGVRRR